MNCTACGSPVGPSDAFCPACGAPLAAAPTTPLQQQPPAAQQPVAPTQVMPQVPAAQYPAQAAPGTWAADPNAQQAQPQMPQQPGYPAQGYAQPGMRPPVPPKKGLSTGAIIGIVAGVLVFLILLGVGGFFGVKALRGKAAEKAALLAGSIVATDPVTPAEDPALNADASTDDGAADTDTDDAASSSDSANDEIITDEQARATVAGFMDARLDRDVNASRKYCNNNFWNGEWHDALIDDTWRPETYEIVNSQPDLMYVHVVVSEVWPSGEEYWIYSCLKDPATGKPVIDGTLDPANVPELLP